jgi:hypothetical protein
VSTRGRPRNAKTGGSVAGRADQVSRKSLESRITVRAIEQALEELGIRARLSDLVAKAQFIEKEINHSRSRRQAERVC